MKTDDGEETKRNLQLTCDIENFKMVAEHYRQDLKEFWTRANFFLLGQTALLSSFLVFLPSITSLEQIKIITALTISIFGLILATLWFFVLKYSVFWIDRWRSQTIKLSKELDRFQCYAEVESLENQKKLRRPTFLTQYMPIIFVVAWLLMIAFVIKTII